MSTISNDTINRVWTKTVHFIAYKTYGLDLSKTAGDIAAEAIEYALKDKKATWNNTSSSEEHLFRVAKKVARWCICKEIDKSKRTHVSYELDSPEEGIDGEPLESSKAETNYVMDCYRAARNYAEMMTKGRLALSRLDGFLAKKGVSPRDIYKDRVLYGMQTAYVCQKYSIKPSNLYKIICVVNGILAHKGRALVCE